ncbi:hypothetical protein DVH05_004513 [Phytophthora capsici]|nr:hypothetical protein DVH05_004513 [Phytophthora capsici]
MGRRHCVELGLCITLQQGLCISTVIIFVFGGDEEFMLGQATMKDISIDVNGLLEQLAGGVIVAYADYDDVTEGVPELGFDDEKQEIRHVVYKLVDKTVEQFWGDSRQTFVHEYEDVCWLHVGADEPARVEPMRITLRENAEPYRSGVRAHSEIQRAFLTTYVQEQLEDGLFRRNNNMRWAFAAFQV